MCKYNAMKSITLTLYDSNVWTCSNWNLRMMSENSDKAEYAPDVL